MFLVPFHIESHRAHTPLRHSLAVFASRSARAQADPGQTHPPFLVFLMLLTAWCLGEALPGEDA